MSACFLTRHGRRGSDVYSSKRARDGVLPGYGIAVVEYLIGEGQSWGFAADINVLESA